MPKGKKRRRPAGAPVAAYSKAEFCEAHGISIRMYENLRKRKEAPREMKVGRRRLISQEAAAEWRAARESE